MQKSNILVLVIAGVVLVATAITLGIVIPKNKRNKSKDGLQVTVVDTPDEDETPIDFRPDDDDGDGEEEIFSLEISSVDSLLTLVEVSSDGKSFKPIGRSYSGGDWEISAGPFSNQIAFFDCDDNSCSIDLPPLPDDGTVYQLTKFSKPEQYTDQDIVARFLEQATFGPTMSMINEFETATDYEFANWIKDQQTNVPLLSHREIFRRRLNARFEVPSRIGPVTQPCQQGTRYRFGAFSVKDSGKVLEVDTAVIGGTERKLLSIEGHVRTIVNSPIRIFNERTGNFRNRNLEDGSYDITFVVEEFGETIPLLNHPDFGRFTVPVFVTNPNQNVFEEEFHTNPPILFYPNYQPSFVIDIPDDGARGIDRQYYEGSTPRNQEILVTSDVESAVCADYEMDDDDGAPVFATWRNKNYIHDPRFRIFDNTLENPLADGGGAIAKLYTNPIEPEFSTICSNVPRTFVNEDSCFLSDSPTACSYAATEAETEGPGVFFVVNHTSMRAIYEASLEADLVDTLYIYAIDGLNITRDPEAAKPCTKGAWSRWEKISCPGNENTGVLPATAGLMRRLIARFEENPRSPYYLDILNPPQVEATCADNDMNKAGFIVSDMNDPSTTCWKNVHPDHMNVYDFAYWTVAHPGNSQTRNPIKEVAEAGNTTLVFPWWHEMSRWNDNKLRFGPPVLYGAMFNFYELPAGIRTEELASILGIQLDTVVEDVAAEESSGVGTLVCGSPNEVRNDPELGGIAGRGAFDAATGAFMTSFDELYFQRQIAWTIAILTDEGQLRQRIAWALSQILTISPGAIDDGEILTEAFLVYYDIFARHAFGNYRNILKEVSYSPMMADMLTYYGGRSTAFVWEQEDNLEFADENYAREVMQLFTTGLYLLNSNGTELVDSNGFHTRVYSNDDIEEYARAWTGFVSQGARGNQESLLRNRIDPMRVRSIWRDRFPKMGLDRKYVGDGYPLCSDLPRRHFLEVGATYQLLGKTSRPEMHRDPDEWHIEELEGHLSLDPNSQLFGELCNKDGNGDCQFPTKVVLSQTLDCLSTECSIDTIRSVEVANGIYYEYIRPPCVQQGFYNNGKTIIQRQGGGQKMCADPRIESASTCCRISNEGEWNEEYLGERNIFETAEERCGANLCTRSRRPDCDEETCGTHFFWTSDACSLVAKINKDGKVAIVHRPEDARGGVVSRVNVEDSQTYFRVDWERSLDDATSNCDSFQACCESHTSCSYGSDDETCICEVEVADESYFTGTLIPDKDTALAALHIGALQPEGDGEESDGVLVYNKANDGSLTMESVFEFVDDNGVRHLRKNQRSMVVVKGSDVTFRNPPHFMHLTDDEFRDVHDETDAVLDHYFFHPNTAPFLAVRFAQRFGISNPSPRYVEAIATAFRAGLFTFQDGEETIEFGTGQYGDLAASFAAVLLHPEARDVILDSDPSHGAFKEPLIKIIGMMRSLDFELDETSPWVVFGEGFLGKVGQMAHEIPSVFSFFLPEYQPSGPITSAKLVAPEAQLLTGPRIVDSMNGFFSLSAYGLNDCLGGFGPEGDTVDERPCEDINFGEENFGVGWLTYKPADGLSGKKVVDQLATLMTAGRLSPEVREVVEKVYEQESEGALEKAQMLISLSPEFHVTNLVKRDASVQRPPEPPSVSSGRPYKALVYVLLEGGYDSYNTLIPHSCTEQNAAGQTLLDQYMNERTTLAFSQGERTRIIDAQNQPCDQFAIHESLPVVERLYNDGDLAFFANVGALDVPVTKDNYFLLTRTQLFAHNTMQEEAQRIDPWEAAPGSGILGRMCDVLLDNGYNAQPITVQDATVATVGVPGEGVGPLIVSADGLNEFAPLPEKEDFNIRNHIDDVNGATKLHSSLYGETWSQRLQKAIHDSDQLSEAIKNVELTQEYQTNGRGSDYIRKIKSLNEMILTHEERGVDRDVFFVSLGNWDHHDALNANLEREHGRLNQALELFELEMKAASLWDDVTMAVTSDFARTLTSNSGEGSDHAWGGNYFILGGSVKGGQIHGDYPNDITLNGPLNIGRGRLIPTSSWETMFNGLVQWMGIETESELDYCMPNRINTETTLFTKDDLFEINY